MSGIDKEFLFGILSEVLRGNKWTTFLFYTKNLNEWR